MREMTSNIILLPRERIYPCDMGASHGDSRKTDGGKEPSVPLADSSPFTKMIFAGEKLRNPINIIILHASLCKPG